MRFNVLGFDQLKASNIGLTLDELMILRHLHDFASSGKMESVIVDNEVYYWVKYDKFVEDLPILSMKKTRVMEIFNNNLCVRPLDWEERYNKMSDSSKKRAKSYKFTGVLKNHTRKDASGTYSYFAFTKGFYDLIPSITGNDEDMKKAPVVPPTEATQKPNKNHNSKKNIPQANEKSKDNKEFKPNFVRSNRFNDGTKNNFAGYGDDELEKMLFESQKGKFK